MDLADLTKPADRLPRDCPHDGDCQENDQLAELDVRVLQIAVPYFPAVGLPLMGRTSLETARAASIITRTKKSDLTVLFLACCLFAVPSILPQNHLSYSRDHRRTVNRLPTRLWPASSFISSLMYSKHRQNKCEANQLEIVALLMATGESLITGPCRASDSVSISPPAPRFDVRQKVTGDDL